MQCTQWIEEVLVLSVRKMPGMLSGMRLLTPSQLVNLYHPPPSPMARIGSNFEGHRGTGVPTPETFDISYGTKVSLPAYICYTPSNTTPRPRSMHQFADDLLNKMLLASAGENKCVCRLTEECDFIGAFPAESRHILRPLRSTSTCFFPVTGHHLFTQRSHIGSVSCVAISRRWKAVPFGNMARYERCSWPTRYGNPPMAIYRCLVHATKGVRPAS